MSTENITEHNLAHFSGGTDQWYRHPLARSVVYTDGCHFLTENGAGWLIDAVASYQGRGVLKTDPMLRDFQLWILKVDLEKKSAVLSCYADDGYPAAITQEIEYTDFPLAEFKLYCERGEYMTIMFPSER